MALCAHTIWGNSPRILPAKQELTGSVHSQSLQQVPWLSVKIRRKTPLPHSTGSDGTPSSCNVSVQKWVCATHSGTSLLRTASRSLPVSQEQFLSLNCSSNSCNFQAFLKRHLNAQVFCQESINENRTENCKIWWMLFKLWHRWQITLN